MAQPKARRSRRFGHVNGRVFEAGRAKPDPRVAGEADSLGWDAEQALAKAAVAVLVVVGLNGVATLRNALHSDRHTAWSRLCRAEEGTVLRCESFGRANRYSDQAIVILDAGQLDIKPRRTGRSRKSGKCQHQRPRPDTSPHRHVAFVAGNIRLCISAGAGPTGNAPSQCLIVLISAGSRR